MIDGVAPTGFNLFSDSINSNNNDKSIDCGEDIMWAKQHLQRLLTGIPGRVG